MRRRLLVGAFAVLLVVGFGTLGYWLLGDGRWSLGECLYMVMISVTTVGFGEVLPGLDQMPEARAFTVALLILGTGTLVYFVSTVTAFVVEGELVKLLRTRKAEKKIRTMKGHTVVLGAGSTGRHIIAELLASAEGPPVVAIDQAEPVLRELATRYPGRLHWLLGDATADEVLEQAAIANAGGVVAALSSDKDNLYVVVTARQQNPSARIVARCQDLSHVDKIRRAGADAVVSPNFIGGMRMASELTRPEVVRFLDEMLRDTRATVRIDEVRVSGGELAGADLGAVRLGERFGVSVLAVRPPGATGWRYNPGAGERVEAGSVLVVLGSSEQVAGLRAIAR